MYNDASEVKTFFRERLGQLMRWNGANNYELAGAADVNVVTIRHALEGSSMPDITTVCRIADFFAVSVDWLLGRVDECDEIVAKENFNKARVMSYEAYAWHKRNIYPIDDGFLPPWPYNLVEEIIGRDNVTGALTEDQLSGLRYVLAKLSTDRTREMVVMKYKDEATLDQIAKTHGLTRERVRQIIAKSIRIMRHPCYANYILNGYEGELKRQELADKRIEYGRLCGEVEAAMKLKAIELKKLDEEINDLECAKFIANTDCGIDDYEALSSIDIVELDLSVRAYNCLKRSGCETVMDIIDLVVKNPAKIDGTKSDILYWNLAKVRNMGKKSVDEVIEKLKERGLYKYVETA